MRSLADFRPMLLDSLSQRIDVARIVMVVVDEARFREPAPTPQGEARAVEHGARRR